MADDASRFWKHATVELRAAGFEPSEAARRNAIVTIASPYTNAHRCNNRVRRIADLIAEAIERRGGKGCWSVPPRYPMR